MDQDELFEIEERAAILEFDGALTRWQAEKAACAERGLERHEVFGRNSEQARNQDTQEKRNQSGNLSAMQSHQEEQKGSMPIGNGEA